MTLTSEQAEAVKQAREKLHHGRNGDFTAVLLDLARTLLEPVEKERDEARAELRKEREGSRW